MRYPEHTLFVRRIILGTNNAGKPCALFRANPLNPRANWGMPVPFLMSTYVENPLDANGSATGYEELPDPVLYFDKYAAPLHAYLPLLQATAHYPIDHNYMKIGYEASPMDRPSRLRETFDTGMHAALLSGRNKCMVKMFERLAAKDYMADDVLGILHTRFEVSERVVRRVLAEAGWEMLPKTNKDGGTTMGPRAEHKLSRAYEYKHLFKELETVARSVRANVPGSSFSMEDLAVDTAPGGYPTHCPVTGLELEYGVSRGNSMRSPKVCRVRPDGPVLAGNVMVTSRLGRGVVEGTMDVERMVMYMRDRPEVQEDVRRWTTTHRVVNNGKIETLFKKLKKA